MKTNVWFVTGASKGLGLALVKKLVDQGYKVAATSRNVSELQSSIGNESASFLPLEIDLTNESNVKAGIEKTIRHFGKIDIVVNNAGYGIGGTVEELSEQETKQSFEINVFATLHVIKAVMPFMRAQKSGHIINISSIAGFAGAIGWSVYAASKAAVVALSEVLAEDVKNLGVNVTVVLPGAFRTSFLTKESLVMSQNIIEDYSDVRESHARYSAMDGKQAGDPEKAAEIFIQLSEMKQPPIKLFLGSDSYNRASAKLEQIKEDLEKNKSISMSTDFTN